MIPEEVTKIISLLTNGMIWIYLLAFIVFSYLLVSLLTWSFIKPLKYLGIPTIIVGILFIVIRFSSSLLLTLIKDVDLSLIKVLLPSVLKPILLIGISCLVIGIGMIVGYKLICKKEKTI